MESAILAHTEQFVCFLLGKSLDKRLYYHNLAHTINVVKNATALAAAEGISEEETELVLIAEWFHDTGFTVNYVGHEEESARIASGFLEEELPADKIKVIADCISATKRGSTPTSTLHCIMHDADYYHLFQPDYFQLVENLRKEVNEVLGKSISVREWYEYNLEFLEQHSFFTTICKSRWKQHKEILLRENKRILNESI